MYRLVNCVLLVSFVVSYNAGTVFGFQNLPLDSTLAVNDRLVTPSGLPADNPFAEPSKLALQAPTFDAIKVEHYLPAFLAGIKVQLGEMEAIAGRSAAPTFANTIVPMEQSGALLSRVERGSA